MDDPQNHNLLIWGVNWGGWKNKHQTYPTLLTPTADGNIPTIKKIGVISFTLICTQIHELY
jgi:hypothetical protein